MADGLLGKCKTCTKRDVRKHYYDTIEAQRAYERKRFQTPQRKAQQGAYQHRRLKAHPGKARAKNAVSNAIRDGKLQKGLCEVCGSVHVQAHHDDYRRPLAVRWLCFKHHREVHGQQAA
jgi:hypothetical protein